MRIVRAVIAVLFVACLVPAVVFAFTYGGAALAGCPIDFKERTVCHIGGTDVGWLIDHLIGFGVYGALTLGIAAYLFASWVMIELSLIVFVRSKK